MRLRDLYDSRPVVVVEFEGILRLQCAQVSISKSSSVWKADLALVNYSLG